MNSTPDAPINTSGKILLTLRRDSVAEDLIQRKVTPNENGF